MEFHTGKNPCPRCRSRGLDADGNNFMFYGEGSGGFCWSCSYTILSDDEKEKRGIGKWAWDEEQEEIMSKETLTREEIEQIKGYTGERGCGLRGITDETYTAYLVRHKYDEATGDPVAQYYPVTEGGKASGYKIRDLPKTFHSVGRVGKDCDMFGMWKWKNTAGRTVVITAGECFKGSTEVMTERGFIRFDALNRSEKILQVMPDFTGEFVDPLAYVEKDYAGEIVHVDTAKVSYEATPNHNMVFVDRDGNHFKRALKDRIPTNVHAKLSIKAGGGGTGLTEDQLALTLAVCADSKIDSRKTMPDYVHFGLMKERKITRLKGLLDRLCIEYTSNIGEHATGKVYTYFNFHLPSFIKGKAIPSEWISTATLEEKDFILSELRWWDGNVAKAYEEFSSKHFSECSTIHALCVTSGRYSTIRRRENKLGVWWVTSIHDKELLGGFQCQKRSSEEYAGKVYCVTVPSGMIQVRINGKVSVVGNCDCLSAYQMLEDYRKSRNNDYEPTPVVSSTIGESGSDKQVAKHYDWFDKFDKIVVCYDQDDAGREAVAKLVKALPKGKMFVMSLPLKDTNLMLTEGKAKQWIDCYYKARPYTPDGIVGSGSLSDKIREEVSIPKIPLPPFMHKLQKMMAGGIPLGRMVNLGSASGTGKSTIVDEILYHWVFYSPHKIGVVTLESDAGQYGLKVLSRHLSQKIELIESVEDKLAFLDQDWVREKEHELLFNADGTDRWHLVEDRDGGIESMKSQITNLIVACECKVIVLDPIQDILDGTTNEEQAMFLRWMKGMMKSHNVTFVNVSHIRKNNTGQKANSAGGDIHEEDMSGSSTIFKSGACNLLFTRNKESADPVERNTTEMKATKIRWTGYTGAAGRYYYDNDHHTLYDFDDWAAAQNNAF